MLVPNPVSLRSCRRRPARSPAQEMRCGHRTWEGTKPVGAESAQHLWHGVTVEQPGSVLLGAVRSDGRVAADTRGWGAHPSTALPAPGAARAAPEEPRGATRLQQPGQLAPAGAFVGHGGCSRHRRVYSSCPTVPQSCMGCPATTVVAHGAHPWVMLLPVLGTACAVVWVHMVPGDPAAARVITVGAWAHGNPGVESPQGHSAMMLQGVPMSCTPRTEAGWSVAFSARGELAPSPDALRFLLQPWVPCQPLPFWHPGFRASFQLLPPLRI